MAKINFLLIPLICTCITHHAIAMEPKRSIPIPTIVITPPPAKQQRDNRPLSQQNLTLTDWKSVGQYPCVTDNKYENNPHLFERDFNAILEKRMRLFTLDRSESERQIYKKRQLELLEEHLKSLEKNLMPKT